MKSVNSYIKIAVISTVLFMFSTMVIAGPAWYENYQRGMKQMEQGEWQSAKLNFENAIKVKPRDNSKQRVGTMFIKYFPHRELGICHYNLGSMAKAQEELQISLRQTPTPRARQYMQLVVNDNPNLSTPGKPETSGNDYIKSSPTTTTSDQPATTVPCDDKSHQLIGDRMHLAVLPFETRGIGEDLGEMNLFDKMITAFIQLNRFVVIERSQLEKILAEHKLGLSGVIDQSTAVEVGKMAGVDAVVFGSIASDKRTVTIDARLVDTETAEVISSRDAFSKNLSLINLSEMITDVAQKIKNDFPIVDGILISANTNNMMIDAGSEMGLKKGMKCYIYREGKPVIHPITGDTLAVKKDILCEMQLTDVYDNYSEGKAINHKEGIPQIGDKIQTK